MIASPSPEREPPNCRAGQQHARGRGSASGERGTIIAFRLLAGAAGSLLLLVGMVFQLNPRLGPVLGLGIPAAGSVLILVILTPAVMRGSWTERGLALMLAALPALMLGILLVFALALAR